MAIKNQIKVKRTHHGQRDDMEILKQSRCVQLYYRWENSNMYILDLDKQEQADTYVDGRTIYGVVRVAQRLNPGLSHHC